MKTELQMDSGQSLTHIMVQFFKSPAEMPLLTYIYLMTHLNSGQKHTLCPGRWIWARRRMRTHFPKKKTPEISHQIRGNKGRLVTFLDFSA